MLHTLSVQVHQLFSEIDSAVTTFASASGLRCPQGCGTCCCSEKVEVTVLEMLPLAFELFRTSQAELLMKRLERNPEEKQCLLYRPDYIRAGLWGCSQYSHRGVICRLFGFAGNRDRTGEPQLAKCRVMKMDCHNQGVPELNDTALSLMPLMGEAGMRITALHPGFGTSRLPINHALYQALVKVGMVLDYARPGTMATTSDTELPPHEPLLPTSPVKKKAA